MNEWSLLIFTFMMNATIGLTLITGLFARRLAQYLCAESYYRFMLPNLIGDLWISRFRLYCLHYSLRRAVKCSMP